MKEMKPLAGKTRLIYLVPSRALVGFRVLYNS
jgi:predicted membrane GTPase involved in stress response